jgi:Terpene synthase family 2, C-terminal metal binding
MIEAPLVPALSCPFDQAISAHADAVDRHVVDWALSFGLARDATELTRLGDTKVGRLAARTTPKAGLTALEFLADWQMWLFLFDDQYCDESATGADLVQLSQVITGFLRVLDNADDHAARVDPFTISLGDLVDRLRLMASEWQERRFISAVRGYFLAQFWEASHRATDEPAGLAEYVAMRRHSGAVPTCIALIDLADGLDTDPEDFCRADVRAVTDMAVNVTCWANDILSYAKESVRSLKVHSLPAVLAAELRMPVTAGIKTAAAMHDAEVARYLAAERVVRDEASPGLAGYLDGLRAWMAGNFYWSMETGRYGLGPAIT